MFLRQSKNKKTGRIYLSIVRGYRNKELGKSRSVVVKSLGYLDELEKEYHDPISHFKKEAEKMTNEHDSSNQPITLRLNINEELLPNSDTKMNLGYAAIMKIFYELELNKFFLNKQRSQNFEYNTNTIMQLLVVSRLLSPASKRKTFNDKNRYFERFDFELHDIYRSLSYFATLETSLQKYIHEQIKKKYGRNTDLVYYDVTNYYFEIDEPDNLRKKGVSKEHRPNPIVQMGLALDTDNIPIAYKLFSGNENDVTTLRPMLRDLKLEYGLKRLIVVADKGINSGDNIHYITTAKEKNGYVISQTIRGATKEFKDYVLEENGYYHKKIIDSDGTESDENDMTFKIKSRLEPRQITVSSANGKKITKTVHEKQVIFYSKKYADKAKADRADAVAKARDLCHNPSKYTRATSKGATKYLKNVAFNIDTGEVIAKKGQAIYFDQEKLKEEEKYDGYYAIVTSEINKSDDWIISTYRGLWKIEESFKVTKSDLEARPVNVSREDHIRAHFLSCFITLVIARILQKKTGNLYSVSKIVNCLNQIECLKEEENLYLFGYRSEVSDSIGSALGIDFTKKRLTLETIKNILAKCKK